MLRLAVIVLGMLIAVPALAAPPYGLQLPIACEPGVDCWILRYVDHGDGPIVKDYRCGPISGDGHKGTDIAIRDLKAMADGVEVRAAAPGVVEALRDGVPDRPVDEGGAAAIEGKECGNGLRIGHGDGWSTWYCHLRRGSLRVREGDRVEAGQPLGLVGLSGETSFPHLHFDLRHGERVVDPFVGNSRQFGCAAGEQPFWSPAVLRKLDYRPLLLTSAGFATAAPERDDIRKGWHHEERLPTTSPALILWAEGYWVEGADRAVFQLLDPDGREILNQTVPVEKDRQHWIGFAGVRRPGERWPAGLYRGLVSLERGATATLQRAVLEREVVLR